MMFWDDNLLSGWEGVEYERKEGSGDVTELGPGAMRRHS